MNCKLIKGKTQKQERQTCLNCPFPQCIFDFEHTGLIPPVALSLSKGQKARRNAQIRQLTSQGHTTAELQTIFQISPRTIKRALRPEGIPSFTVDVK
jgi:hypothetical protein